MSVVNHKYQYIFGHEPHTGGRAIEKALMKHEGSENFNGEHHILPKDMVKKGFVTEEQCASYKKFCVIRDPHDLLLTGWIAHNRQQVMFHEWALSPSGRGLMRDGTLFWRYAEFCPWHVFYENLEDNLNRILMCVCKAPPVKLDVVGQTTMKPDWRDLVTINQANTLKELYPDIRRHGYNVLMGD